MTKKANNQRISLKLNKVIIIVSDMISEERDSSRNCELIDILGLLYECYNKVCLAEANIEYFERNADVDDEIDVCPWIYTLDMNDIHKKYLVISVLDKNTGCYRVIDPLYNLDKAKRDLIFIEKADEFAENVVNHLGINILN